MKKPRIVRDHKETAEEIVEGARRLGCIIGNSDAEVVRDRIAEELQDRFDLGAKAVGGSIIPWPEYGLIEVAFTRDEVDVLMALLDIPPIKTPTTESILEKIGIFASQRRHA